MLTISNASKTFEGKMLFQNLDLQIDRASITGLTGPSGCGKSTLLRCIQQLENPDSGSIHIQGKSGFMFQDFQLFPHMTVLKNLTFAPELHQMGSVTARAITLLEQLGIAEKAQSMPPQLSGGQKQRAALARSLMMQPDLLLCDEPVSGLDAKSIDDVIALLNQVKSMGIALLIASHDIPFLKRISDKILCFEKQTLIEH